MKATGIVRRIDDLGRVVIPKEIRRTLGLRENDPVEIYIEGGDTICLRRCQVNLNGEIDHLADIIEIYGDTYDYEKMAQIKALLSEVRKLVKSEG